MKKTKRNYNLLVLLAAVILMVVSMSACDINDELKDIDVYVGGGYSLGDNYYSCYWVNGERTDINKLHSIVDVAASGDDYYASANVKIDGRVIGRAAYWKNGEVNELLEGWSSTRSIIVQDKVVNILGYSFDETVPGRDVTHWLWQNGEFTELDGYVMAMHIDGYDTYLAGMYSEDDRTPCYWINGAQYDLDSEGLDLSALYVKGIAVQDDDVYVIGSYWDNGFKTRVACYWKNGERFELEKLTAYDSSETSGICIDSGNVYVSGQKNCVACYWKNGKRIELGSGSGCSYAMDITVVKGNVYIAGHRAGEDSAVYVWKNDKNKKAELSYPWAISRSGWADSIFIKEKN